MKKYASILLLLFASINQLSGMNKDINLHIYKPKYLYAPRTAFILNTIQAIYNQKSSNEFISTPIPVIQYFKDDTNRLGIIANNKDWCRLEKLINELDKPQPQVDIMDLIDLFKFKEYLKEQK